MVTHNAADASEAERIVNMLDGRVVSSTVSAPRKREEVRA
jgi:ABC-type lipoprotein export system ATPase subunit